MAVRIGKLQLKTAVPEDLHRRLLAATGCSIAEIARILDGPCIAGSVAAALAPILAEPLSRIDLARLIADAGVDVVRPRVARLYAEILHPKESSHGRRSD